ncbi:hypothetical protein C9374_003955 [Naegleria lovaniensis]|uniref:Uncharacterized protein n=1 Tax=Naegleria lovaniensis TaxID=51637 RepID=A0AA88KSJ2_NAELO|nr:uncharacterized protein C9374_003955 [Naegleria lovaniensis]KAG2394191.1 hypothetical protein C9374_003955 [Naegleria lovaniensis]
MSPSSALNNEWINNPLLISFVAGASSSLLTYAFRKLWNSSIRSTDEQHLPSTKTAPLISSDRHKQEIKKELITTSKVAIYGGVLWSSRELISHVLFQPESSFQASPRMFIPILAGCVSGASERLLAYLCGDHIPIMLSLRLIGRSTLTYALFHLLKDSVTSQVQQQVGVVTGGETETTTREGTLLLGHFLTAAVVSVGTHLCCNYSTYRSSSHYLNYSNLLREGIAGGIVYTSYEIFKNSLLHTKTSTSQ